MEVYWKDYELMLRRFIGNNAYFDVCTIPQILTEVAVRFFIRVTGIQPSIFERDTGAWLKQLRDVGWVDVDGYVEINE